jgi:hypothetical protein
MVTKLLHWPPLSTAEPLNSKTTFLVQYISGKADLVGQNAANIFVEYFRQRQVAALSSLRRACAGSIIAM